MLPLIAQPCRWSRLAHPPTHTPTHAHTSRHTQTFLCFPAPANNSLSQFKDVHDPHAALTFTPRRPDSIWMRTNTLSLHHAVCSYCTYMTSCAFHNAAAVVYNGYTRNAVQCFHKQSCFSELHYVIEYYYYYGLQCRALRKNTYRVLWQQRVHWPYLGADDV